MHQLRHRWTDLPVESPLPGIDRRRVIGEQAMISHIRLSEGSSVPSHSHPNEQFAIVVSGKLRFELRRDEPADCEIVDVSGGEVLHLPANLEHSAVALEETIVLDVFSPPSESTGIDE